MKKLIWTLAFALLCLSSCRDYRYRVEDSIYVPVVSDISILDIQENCATLSFEVRETSELGVGQCGILFSLSDFDNPKEAGNNIIYIDCGRGPGIHEYKLQNLSPSKMYWICAYAKNDRQIAYTNVISFTTTKPQASVAVNRAVIASPIYTFDSDEYLYDIDITFDLRGSSFSKVGVRVPDGTVLWSSETPASTGLFQTSVLYSTSQSLSSLNLTPVVQTSDGREFLGDSYYLSVPGSGIKGNALLQLTYADYYSEPGRQYYIYGFRATVYLKSGASLMKKFTSSVIYEDEYNETEIENFQDGHTYYNDFSLSSKARKLSQMMFSARAYYGDNSSDNVFFPGTIMEPSYEMAPNSADIFYIEDFNSATNRFTVKDVLLPEGFQSGWFWDSKSKLMKANAYKNGVNYDSESWLISDEINLTGRKSAILQLQYAVRYMGNINEQAKLKVSLDGGNSWKDLTIPDFANLNENKLVYRAIDVSQFCGKKIRIAFVYKGSSTAGSGYWWIKSVLFYEEDIKKSSSSQNLNVKSYSQPIHRRPVVGYRSDEL